MNRVVSVFLNCPFDKSYAPMFEALVFTIFDCGFVPRCSLEASDSTQNRLSRIVHLIEQCDYAVDDISYTQLDPVTRLPRFNMPFELGLYFGCQQWGGKAHHGKTSLVLDREPFRYRAFLSDISGQDVRSHGGRPETAVREVRDWLRTRAGGRQMPGGTEIWLRYKRFRAGLPRLCGRQRIRIEEITFLDLTDLVALWLKRGREPKR